MKNVKVEISYWPLLIILLIGLKLTGYLEWSWWWVLAPIWGPAAFFAVAFLIILAGLFIKEWYDSRHR